MKVWNVVATAREPHFSEAVHVLKRLGQVDKTHYYDVLVMKVDDPLEFLKQLHVRVREDLSIAQCIGHVAPCLEAFTFQDPDEFEEDIRQRLRGVGAENHKGCNQRFRRSTETGVTDTGSGLIFGAAIQP